MTQRTRSTPAPAAAHWLALDHQLCFALYSASLAMTKVYKPLLEPLGLTYPQYLAMLVLWEGDGITVGQIGERLKLDSGTLTPLLKRLEAQGLVQRLRDSADERRVLLRLSAEGRKLKARAVAVPQAIACAAACDLDEIAALVRQLGALRDRLSQTDPSTPRAA
ncbi:MarR family winged helix-turn-helix transcriptional regulator [Aquabacterium sp.]|uniref:MarR family winged helix-turn-helix transcriptional regulator n=1 Tax=Aquabacterium sp. TaxID=1872578 RepID=UPI0037832F8E